MATERTILMAGTDERDLTKLAEYQAIGGYEALAKARALTPSAVIDELLDVEPARPRRRVLPDGPQGELRPERPDPKPTISSSTPTSPSPAASRTARSCRASRTG